MLEVKQDEDDYKTWKSCCFQLNSQCVTYTGQLSFSIAVLGICTLMLVKADGDCSMSSPYINIISFLAGKILSSVITSVK